MIGPNRPAGREDERQGETELVTTFNIHADSVSFRHGGGM